MAKINVNAQETIASIRELINVMKTLSKETARIGNVSGSSFTKLQSDIKALRSAISTISKKFTELNKNLNRNSNITKTNSKRLTKNSAEIKRNSDLTKTNSKNKRENTKAIDRMSSSLNRETRAKQKSNRQNKKNIKGQKGFFGAMAKGIGTVMAIVAALGFLIKIGKNIFNLALKFDSLALALKFTSKQSWEAGRSMQFLLELNQKFGAQIGVTADRWLKFRTAARLSGLTMLETKKIFKSVTKASALLGLQTDELKGVYLALEQMLNKGKITTEELRRQLGERLPGAVGIMAASMGIGLEELDKMMKKGEVLSAEVLPNFAKALEIAYGIDKVDSIENLNTAVNKLKGSWETLVLIITEGDSIISKSIMNISQSMTSILNKLTYAFADTLQTENLLSGMFDVKHMKEYEDNAEELMQNDMHRAKIQRTQLQKNAKELARLQDEIYRTAEGEQKKSLQRQYDEIQLSINKSTKFLVEVENEKSRIMHIAAVGNVKTHTDEYDEKRRIVEESEAESKDLIAKVLQYGEAVAAGNPAGVIMSALFGDSPEENMKDFFDSLSDEMKDYIKAASQKAVTLELAETAPPKRKPIDDDDGSKRKRKIKMAKEYNGTLEDEILILQRIADLNNRVFGQVGQDMDDTKRSLDEYIKSLIRINELEFDEKNNDLRAAEKDEKNKWKARMDSWDKGASNYQEQVEQHKIALKNIEKKYDDLRLINQQNYLNKRAKINFTAQDKEIAMIKKFEKQKIEDATTDNNLAIKGIEMAMLKEHEGTAQYNKLYKLREEMLQQHQNNLIDIQVEALEKQAKAYLDSGDMDMANRLMNLANALNGTKNGLDEVKPSVEEIAEVITDIMDTMGDLGNALFESKIARIDEEIARETEKYDTLLRLAKDDEAEQKIIERNREIRLKKLNEKKKKEQIKQAKFEKAMNIARGTVALALAIQYAFAQQTPPAFNVAQAAIVAALSGVELATIIATPIPTFATGGVMGHDGKALINDGGQMEYVQRGGKIMTAKNENALVDLKRGDIIHKDFETMQRKTSIFNSIFGVENESTQNEIDFGQIELAIERGFKNAKINNNISVINELDDYREKQQNWS